MKFGDLVVNTRLRSARQCLLGQQRITNAHDLRGDRPSRAQRRPANSSEPSYLQVLFALKLPLSAWLSQSSFTLSHEWAQNLSQQATMGGIATH